MARVDSNHHLIEYDAIIRRFRHEGSAMRKLT
jgi:hypothetical protein